MDVLYIDLCQNRLPNSRGSVDSVRYCAATVTERLLQLTNGYFQPPFTSHRLL
jgi:hypothetical protein